MVRDRPIGAYVCGCGRNFGSATGLIAHAKAKHGGTPAPGVACPYCGNPSRFMHSSEALYNGRDYGPAWVCLPCQAWVGCHPDTAMPLGRLADKALREAKSHVHREFDPIWKRGYLPRSEAYRQLAEMLGISPKVCHVGMFDVELCERAAAACQELGPRSYRAWKAKQKETV